jgi:acyl dehydratase
VSTPIITTFTAPLPSKPTKLAVGDEMPRSAFGPVTRTDIVRHAGAGGDFHPLHHDELYAKEAGFPGVFAMGLMQAGMLGNRLARWVGPSNIRTYNVRFTSQVWPGDELEFTGHVESVTEVDGEYRAGIALTVLRRTGDPVITATATAAIAPPKESS